MMWCKTCALNLLSLEVIQLADFHSTVQHQIVGTHQVLTQRPDRLLDKLLAFTVSLAALLQVRPLPFATSKYSASLPPRLATMTSPYRRA